MLGKNGMLDGCGILNFDITDLVALSSFMPLLSSSSREIWQSQGPSFSYGHVSGSRTQEVHRALHSST